MKEIVSVKNQKLLKLLTENGFSYSVCQRALRKKDVSVNGKRVNSDREIFAGDKIVVYATETPKKYADVIFEDQNVLACYKYSGVTSDEVFENLKKERQVFYVHRLDRNTDGIMLFAKTTVAEVELLNAFKNRTFDKYYLCEVYGKMAEKSKTLTDYLLKDSEKAEVKIFNKQVPNSVKIITEYKVIETRENSSILEVKLITGKTHQIRAHLAFYGHFIIGDGKYGNQKINREFGAKTQRLTSYKLKLKFSEGPLEYLDGKTLEIKNPYATGRIHT